MTHINTGHGVSQKRMPACFRMYTVLISVTAFVLLVHGTAAAQTGSVETLPAGMTVWTGDIVVHANADSFYVKAGKDVHYIASGDTVSFTGRLTSIRVSARNFRDGVVEFEPFTNAVKTLQIYLVPATGTGQMRDNLFYYMHYDANLSIAANPDTRLYVDGVQAGTGRVMLKLPPGMYRVRSEEPGAGNRTRRIELTDTRLVHLNMHIQPTRGEIRLLSWIPGASQYRKREKVKSAVFAATVFGGMVTSVLLHGRWQSRLDEFNKLRDEYWVSNTEPKVIQLGEQVRNAERRANNTGRQLTWVIGTTAVMYAWNVFDGLQTPRMGYRTEDTFNPYIVLDAGSSAPLLGLRVNF
ncbi:MAG: PEGA domain-containing protein [Cyclonatronaceae bacterium]